MPKTVVDFPVFDADNHMYETTDVFTKFLPKEYDGLVKYVQVNGRTKIAVRNVISDYIPNPTFEVVGRPGAQEAYFKEGNPEGKSRRELIGEAMRSPEGFFAPEPRLKIMDELGIDRYFMWPTLASLLEERLADDPKATHAVVHALNQWMLEHWTFNYEGRIFPTPIITLPIVTEAIKELEWVVERGAKIILVRPAPVPGYEGRRSFALPEFDPFWDKVAEFDVAVGMHASDDGLTRYYDQWGGRRGGVLLGLWWQERLFGHRGHAEPRHLRHRGLPDRGRHAERGTPRYGSCRSRTVPPGCAPSSTPSPSPTSASPPSTTRTP